MQIIEVNAKQKQFLDLIALCEGTSSSPITRACGYDVIVTGVNGPSCFTDFSRHPFSKGEPLIEVVRPVKSQYENVSFKTNSTSKQSVAARPGLFSSASGRYQILLGTWNRLACTYGYPDFCPVCQDYAALRLIDEHHAMQAVLTGEVEFAVKALCFVWASLPGNLYRQGGRTIEWILEQYKLLEVIP